MFSLIITIISIALVTALALATIFYGANFMQDGSSRALAARAIQEGNQVRGAIELYRTEHGSLPTGTAAQIETTLTAGGKYLKAWPDTVWSTENDMLVRSGLTEKACFTVNQNLGVPGDTIPACTDEGIASTAACCTVE